MSTEQLQKKVLKQGYRYDKLRKTFSKLYYRNLPLISKYKCNLKTLLRQSISHPEFYGDVKPHDMSGNIIMSTSFCKVKCQI